MASQEEFQNVVQKYAQEHNLTVEEAEVLVKKKMGMGSGTSSDLAIMSQLFHPKENPMVDAINTAIAARIGQALFPERPPGGGPGNPPGGMQPDAITAAIARAKEAGVGSLYLPDGTQIMLQPKNDDSSSITKSIEQKIREYVDGAVSEGLPKIFNPLGNKGTDLPPSTDPAYARLFFEDKWKDKDREAAAIKDKARDEVIVSVAAAFGAALSPEGFDRIKQQIKQGGAAGASTKGKGEEKSKAPMVKAACWKCRKPFRYDQGEEAICPYCRANQNVQCPSCEAIFTPTNATAITCPKCGAALTLPGEKTQEETKDEETSPSSGEEDRIS